MSAARFTAVVAAALFCLTTASCAHFRGKDKPDAVKTESAKPAPAAMTESDYESALRAVVQDHVQKANASKEQDQSRVIRRRPYYLREYSVYTHPEQDPKIVLQQKEKKTSPYIADVTLDKERYATRLHRKRAEAAADASFLRDTGTEMLTYEWRNGGWIKAGSIFIADKSEENVNGEWVAVAETSKRTAAAEEPKSEGFLKQIWYTLTGK
jgi:hypothetical protein